MGESRVNKVRVSIILPTYNRGDLIERCVQSVLNQSFVDWELIIADDASTDDSRSVVERVRVQDDRIEYFRNEKRLGLPANRARAIERSRGDYVFFIEDDIVLDSEALRVLVNTFEEVHNCDKQIAAVAPALVSRTEESGCRRTLLNHSRKLITRRLRERRPYFLDKMTGLTYRDYSADFPDLMEVGDIHACSLYSRDVFDGDTRHGEAYLGNFIGEESELHLRMTARGMRLFFQPKAILNHDTVETGGCRQPFLVWVAYFVRNHFCFVVRNYGLRALIMIPCFVVFSIMMVMMWFADSAKEVLL